MVNDTANGFEIHQRNFISKLQLLYKKHQNSKKIQNTHDLGSQSKDHILHILLQ